MTGSGKAGATRSIEASRIRVRRAVVADAAQIAVFTERIFELTFGPDNSADDMAAYLLTAFGEDIQARQLAQSDCVHLILEVDGTLAACACLLSGATDPAVHGEAPVEIQRFYVDPEFHGVGIAFTLMQACMHTARAGGGRTLWLGVWERNRRAIRFYEKCGLLDVGSHAFVLGSDVQCDRVMQCDLRDTAAPGGSL